MIRDANDVPIAIYTGDKVQKHIYRQHLAEYYGKYMMTYSGIHYNYSFSDDILKHNFNEDTGIKNAQNAENYKKYKEKFYLHLAEQVLAHSWMVVALLAASPIADNSFFEVGHGDKSVFTGFSSLRCSEHGYWNIFSPVLDYSSIDAYTDSIESYLHQGLLAQASELYYPVRLKPIGHYTLDNLRKNGISHIELRMIDLNPFSESGVALSDLEFIRLLLVYLASQNDAPLTPRDQLQSLQNHKNASNYDWDIARITLGSKSLSLTEALSEKLNQMQSFYADSPQAIAILSAQWDKLNSKSNRYAYRVRAEYGKDYIGGGIRRAKEIQECYNV
jgi:glutamate--cysteine ligase